MPSIKRKISLQEKLILKNNSADNLLALSLRYYESYRLGESQDLHKALRAAISGFKENSGDIGLLLACAFYHCEIGNEESSENCINMLKPYRNFYKNKNSVIYALIIYINAIYDLNIVGKRSIKKHIKVLAELSDNCYYADLLLGDLYFRQEDFPLCLDYIEKAYESGCNSFYLFILYHDILNSSYVDDNGYLLMPFLNWANNQRIELSFFIKKSRDLINDFYYGNEYFFDNLYSDIQDDILLEIICKAKLSNKDTSENAYSIYKKAEQKQIFLDGISACLIRSAFIHKDEEVSLFALNSYLNEQDIDVEMMAFVYHIILSKPKFLDCLEEFDLTNSILSYGSFALNSGFRDREHNSIYRFLLEHAGEKSDISKKIEDELYNNIFSYKLEVKGLEEGFVYVHEKEKNGIGMYGIVKGKARILAATGNISLFFFDKENKSIVDCEYTCISEIENKDEWLYKYFIDKGYNDNNLYIALSSLYINKEDIDEESIGVLNKTLSLTALSRAFRMEVGVALGNILSSLELHEKALEYFNEVDESNLNERYVEIMLTAFVNASEFNKAVRLIVKKREFICDSTLAYALKNIATDKSFHPLIADAAYELLIKNRYDAKLLDIVIKHYKGSQSDWFILRQSLGKMNVSHISLDKKILENSLIIRDFSIETQEVFHRFFRTGTELELIDNFAYYACYEIIAMGVKPEYEVIADLEKIFKASNQRIIAYALSKIYLKYNVSTFNSAEIMENCISFMEEDNVILPEFKDIKDKNILTPYIEKNQPFIYHSSADKNVSLYFKIDKNGVYEKKEMRHFAFGIFVAVLPIFYKEEVYYYISEEMKSGSVNTMEDVVTNTRAVIKPQTNDLFFSINNALIYDHMFKYNEAEKIITDLIQSKRIIRAKII